MKKYQVIVGNIGTVIDTNQLKEAIKIYSIYKNQSKGGYGRAGNERVTMMKDGEIKWEFIPKKKLKITKKEIEIVLKSSKRFIHDDYKEDGESIPHMTMTFAADETGWSYQSGDNSFHGGAYGYRHWGVVELHRRSNCKELAREAYEQIAEAFYEDT
jgi:hypothetical protein